MTMHKYTWPHMTRLDYICHTWPYLTIHGNWPYMTTHYHTWPHMTTHDHTLCATMVLKIFFCSFDDLCAWVWEMLKKVIFWLQNFLDPAQTRQKLKDPLFWSKWSVYRGYYSKWNPWAHGFNQELWFKKYALDPEIFVKIWRLGWWVKYQPSDEGGTRSPPATPHGLKNPKWPPEGPKMAEWVWKGVYP